jgi:hypothetical protein
MKMVDCQEIFSLFSVFSANAKNNPQDEILVQDIP